MVLTISRAYHERMLQDLELRHLSALRSVVREGGFARAADRLGYTQSAVSQQIAALERAVGAAVFDRPGGPRPVELTPFGRLLLGHADDILTRVAAISDDIDRFRAGEAGRLDIGTFQSVSVELLPRIIGLLRAERPGIEIRLTEADDPQELADLVRAGELDLSFITGDFDASALDTVALGEDPFVAVTRHGWLDGVAPGGPIATRELLSAPLIGQNDGACQRTIDRGLAASGTEPVYVFRSNDNSAVQAMVRAGMGAALLPLLAVDIDDPRIEVHPIDPPIPDRVISIIRRHGRSSAPAAERFVELACDAWASIAGQRSRRALTSPTADSDLAGASTNLAVGDSVLAIGSASALEGARRSELSHRGARSSRHGSP